MKECTPLYINDILL